MTTLFIIVGGVLAVGGLFLAVLALFDLCQAPTKAGRRAFLLGAIAAAGGVALAVGAGFGVAAGIISGAILGVALTAGYARSDPAPPLDSVSLD